MKTKQTCQFCGKKFKRVKGHTKFCKAQPMPKAPTSINEATYSLNKAEDVYRNDQRLRGNNVLIELASSISRLNNAFATVVGEWRF